MEALSLDVLCGPALVCHALNANALTADVFEAMNIPAGTERLLVRTRNSDLWARGVRDFNTDYAAVTADGARWLVEHRVKVIGVRKVRTDATGRVTIREANGELLIEVDEDGGLRAMAHRAIDSQGRRCKSGPSTFASWGRSRYAAHCRTRSCPPR